MAKSQDIEWVEGPPLRYSLWSMPKSAWGEIPRVPRLTPEEIEHLREVARTANQDPEFLKRIAAFRTPVSWETMQEILP